ncbi:unnamed protein product [Rotaria sp. Silwood2]|nr:unnamed protein product [Rotaria sp. Silwood2]CAF2892414.1 unnamed protein product [Rotaria sp. Silwood2]CAF3139259.1 unnamed protein product [Rotaria sp. Silwood2]CAF3304060.1 unnamed protein product [Rotaria sp. Silwood2]CAF4094242.1 unnamed protein product [Rotaria sp. Silwood2]
MFKLDVRHYVATLMHPRYRQLKGCTRDEREQQQQKEDCQPPRKKSKINCYILEEYEDDSDDGEQFNDEFNSSESEDYVFNPPKSDELPHYLCLKMVKTSLTDNPLDFWLENQNIFLVLSKLARPIHCIPASSVAIERQFSGAGFIINERRTALDPEQLNNIIFIRSMKNIKLI